MTLVIQKPTGAKLNLRKTWQPMDPDAAAYITAVEAADTAAGQSGGLEEKTKIAIDNFVLGCKADGIWSAIKASCILAGARTLAGALVPLAGTAPTNPGNVFVQADYNRKTGLVGNGSTKYLNSNRANNADPQTNCHMSVYATNKGTPIKSYIGNLTPIPGSQLVIGVAQMEAYVNGGAAAVVTSAPSMGMIAGMRQGTTTTCYFAKNVSVATGNPTSVYPTVDNYVFARNSAGSANIPVDARLAFYSIGESLDLAKLDARVTDLINAFGVAIP
jgi:hypothetical protein